jgi:nucleotide-binding universal stress UspA family protein
VTREKVIAAIDTSAAAHPVITVAGQIAALFNAELEVVHAGEGDDARAQAEAAGVPLRTLAGPAGSSVVGAAEASDVAALVIGARGTPAGRRPVGRTAGEMITTLAKPVIVVPPDVVHPERLESMLVPLDAARQTDVSVRNTIEIARRAGIKVVIFHVHRESTVPPFSDQPQHETTSWSHEFLLRHCSPPPNELDLELRVGVPADQIVHAATTLDADLIALAWARNLSAERAEVVRATLSGSPVPVILLPILKDERQTPPKDR